MDEFANQNEEHTAEDGTSQGGPLSPLLSNIILDELDKELKNRGVKSLYLRYSQLRKT